MREFSNRSGDFAIVVPVHRVGTYCKPYHRTCAWPSSIGHSILKLPATLSPKNIEVGSAKPSYRCYSFQAATFSQAPGEGRDWHGVQGLIRTLTRPAPRRRCYERLCVRSKWAGQWAGSYTADYQWQRRSKYINPSFLLTQLHTTACKTDRGQR